jgi:ATP-dependent DNA ligase
MFEREIFGYRLGKLTELDSEALYGVPIKPMLGRPAKSAKDVLASLHKSVALDRLVAEFKYDGERTQIHYSGGKVKLFSRNCDSQKDKFWQV